MGTCTAAAAIFSLVLIWFMILQGLAPGLHCVSVYKCGKAVFTYLSILLMKDIRGTLYLRI